MIRGDEIEYFKYNPKQTEFLKKISDGYPAKDELGNEIIEPYKHICLYGGARSGKTFLIAWSILMRAYLYPYSKHVIIRDKREMHKETFLKDTFPKLFRYYPFNGDRKMYSINKHDFVITLSNGSSIIFLGIYGESGMDKMLGIECQTLYFNECSLIKEEDVFDGVAWTRLNGNIVLDRKFLKSESFKRMPTYLPLLTYYDFNPDSDLHWTYKYFIENKNPITNKPNSSPILVGHFVPSDNLNISKNYIKNQQETLSEDGIKRFVFGEFVSSRKSVIKKEYFRYYTRDQLKGMSIDKIFITTDYATTVNKKSDYTVLCCWAYVNNGADNYGIYLLDMFRIKEEAVELTKITIEFAQKWQYGISWHRASPHLSEINIEATSNQFLIGNLQTETGKKQDELFVCSIVNRIRKGKSSKYMRLSAVLHIIKSGKIFLPHPELNEILGVKSIEEEIINPILKECESFKEQEKRAYIIKDDIVDNIIDAIENINGSKIIDFQSEIKEINYGIKDYYNRY